MLDVFSELFLVLLNSVQETAFHCSVVAVVDVFRLNFKRM